MSWSRRESYFVEGTSSDEPYIPYTPNKLWRADPDHPTDLYKILNTMLRTDRDRHAGCRLADSETGRLADGVKFEVGADGSHFRIKLVAPQESRSLVSRQWKRLTLLSRGDGNVLRIRTRRVECDSLEQSRAEQKQTKLAHTRSDRASTVLRRGVSRLSVTVWRRPPQSQAMQGQGAVDRFAMQERLPAGSGDLQGPRRAQSRLSDGQTCDGSGPSHVVAPCQKRRPRGLSHTFHS
jgi:hypothetical protein